MPPERRPAPPQACGAPLQTCTARHEQRPLFGHAKRAELATGSNPVFRHTTNQPADALLLGPVRIPVLPQVCCEAGRGDMSETAASSGFSHISRRYRRGLGVFSENDGWRANYRSLKGLAADGGSREFESISLQQIVSHKLDFPRHHPRLLLGGALWVGLRLGIRQSLDSRPQLIDQRGGNPSHSLFIARHPQQLRRLDLQDRGQLGSDLQARMARAPCHLTGPPGS